MSPNVETYIRSFEFCQVGGVVLLDEVVHHGDKPLAVARHLWLLI
jgi:hypothetical protein